MKIEVGESLILSWLKHIKECQITQTNWKASSKWELKNGDVLERLMKNSSEFFRTKYGYDLFKGNSGLEQLILQAEIDVIGISYDDDGCRIYAIDVAFHEAGLNYGSKEETVTRVIKKCIRTAICIYGYYGFNDGTIIFASPKINPAVINAITECIEDMNRVINDLGLKYEVRIIANEDFSDKILEPVLNVLGDVADTSELFMRSLQLYNLFAIKKPRTEYKQQVNTPKRITPQLEGVEYSGLDGLEEMKIGAVVRIVLRKMLEEGQVTAEEIELMQTSTYSKEKFHIQYPLLVKAEKTNGKSPTHYYSPPITIYGINYFLCCEWFEQPPNNDRPYLMKWMVLNKNSNE